MIRAVNWQRRDGYCRTTVDAEEKGIGDLVYARGASSCPGGCPSGSSLPIKTSVRIMGRTLGR